MTKTVEAICERGVLRLKEPIQLADGTEVEVTVMERLLRKFLRASPRYRPKTTALMRAYNWYMFT